MALEVKMLAELAGYLKIIAVGSCSSRNPPDGSPSSH